MPQIKKKKNSKAASGMGNIRKKTVRKGDKEYEYWEARYTVGFDPGTGKQVQKSVSGKTQKEVAQKLKELTAALDAGTYIAPSKMTVGQWLDIWQSEYLSNVKPSTVSSYDATIRNHLKPGIGAIRLDMLTTHDIQEFYNNLFSPEEDVKGLSAKTIKNIHGILHQLLDNRGRTLNHLPGSNLIGDRVGEQTNDITHKYSTRNLIHP